MAKPNRITTMVTAIQEGTRIPTTRMTSSIMGTTGTTGTRLMKPADSKAMGTMMNRMFNIALEP